MAVILLIPWSGASLLPSAMEKSLLCAMLLWYMIITVYCTFCIPNVIVIKVLSIVSCQDFSISDGDSNELDGESFKWFRTSRLETWCLVRATNMDSYELDHPHSELMRYDVHPNALTQSGNYHFSCEFPINRIYCSDFTSTSHPNDLLLICVTCDRSLLVWCLTYKCVTCVTCYSWLVWFMWLYDVCLTWQVCDTLLMTCDSYVTCYAWLVTHCLCDFWLLISLELIMTCVTGDSIYLRDSCLQTVHLIGCFRLMCNNLQSLLWFKLSLVGFLHS